MINLRRIKKRKSEPIIKDGSRDMRMTWTTKRKVEIKICEMETDHIRNCKKMVENYILKFRLTSIMDLNTADRCKVADSLAYIKAFDIELKYRLKQSQVKEAEAQVFDFF